MLQWTNQGQETLQAARRQHNGGVECYRKMDYAASKRFLQNALRLRKTVLSQSHPIILGNIEMLSIVSNAAQNTLRPGCALPASLFPTAVEQPPVNHDADDKVLLTGVGTIPQLARLKLRDDPIINARFDPGSPQFTLFKTPDGAVIDPCLVDQHMNKEELKMILWDLFYLQQLRLGPYHVDTQLTLERLWEIATDMRDSAMAEALSKKIWEMRCSSPSQRRAVAMSAALGVDSSLAEDSANNDSVLPPSVHPSTLLFASPMPPKIDKNAISDRFGTPQEQPYSDFDFTLSNLERKESAETKNKNKYKEASEALSNYYVVRPKLQRKIPLLEDDSWEQELRRRLGVDKDVSELLSRH